MNKPTLVCGECFNRMTSSTTWREFLLSMFGLEHPMVYGMNYVSTSFDKRMVNGKFRPLVIFHLFDGRYPTTIDSFMDNFLFQLSEERLGKREIVIHTVSKTCMEYILKNCMDKFNFKYYREENNQYIELDNPVERIRKDFDIR